MRWLTLCFPGWISSAEAAPFQNALRPAGIQAERIFDLWNLTLIICTLVFVAVVAAFLYAIRRAPRADESTPPDIKPLTTADPVTRRSVLAAVMVSTLLLFVLLVADITTDRALAQLPLSDGLHIELTGHQWWWEARYSGEPASQGFTTANELHIPVGKPVVLTLKSTDVIHSFWVPNLHGKKDMIPGRTATIELRADKPGVYRGQCAEFCGYQHAKMALLVIAEPQTQYDAWAARQRRPAENPTTELAVQGQKIFLSGTCVMCHTVQGTPANAMFGPDLTHVASRRTLAAGTLPNTDTHRLAWMADPQEFKPGTNMPPTRVSPEELQALAAYLDVLK